MGRSGYEIVPDLRTGDVRPARVDIGQPPASHQRPRANFEGGHYQLYAAPRPPVQVTRAPGALRSLAAAPPRR